MTTPVSISTLKNKLCIGARLSGHVRENDVIKDVKAIIRKLKKLNKNNTSSILVHEGHLYFHLWPGSISNQGIKGLIKGSRCFYFTRVLPYIFGSLGMSGSYSKLAKDQGTETSTIKPLKIHDRYFWFWSQVEGTTGYVQMRPLCDCTGALRDWSIKLKLWA